jgi:RNase H-fold protein (predicted Holliday junction resolvase)
MAQVQQLQPGQLNPQAQPVSTFIQQTRRDTMKVARPELLGQTSQIQTIATGGTNMVQGENSFRTLANDLKNFNPQLMKTAEAAGLKYVDWRMDVGEAMAMEQVQLGLAQLDESTEVAQNDRAAANRKVSAVDPQAGWLMRTLDPYQQMGFERGKVKIAGQQVALGLSEFVNREANAIDPETGRPYVDYEAPDLGMKGLQKLQGLYQKSIERQAGISSSSPGYQKYFAPQLLRAQEQLAQEVIDDRTAYFESKIKPQAITSVKQDLDDYAGSQGYKTFISSDGTPIAYAADPVAWQRAAAFQLSQRFTQVTARAPLGMRSEIAQELYSQLSSQYAPGSVQRQVLDRMGIGGGFTLGDKYGYLARDADSEYVKREAGIITNEQKILKSQFFDELRLNNSNGFPLQQSIDRSVQQIEGAIGRPLTPQERQRLTVDAIQEFDQVSPTLTDGAPQDPQAADRLIREITSQSPYEINVTEARQQLDAIRDSVPATKQEEFLAASRAVTAAENAQREQATWYGKYSNQLESQTNELLDEELVLIGPIKSNAKALITQEVQKRMTSILQKKTIENNGQPVSQEVINSAWFEVWNGPKGLQQEVLDGKFKIPGVKDTPAPAGEIPEPVKADPKEKNPVPKGVDLGQLNSFPRRSVRLRSYQDVTQGPILTGKALIQVMQAAASGQKENPAFTKAWRQSGAPNAWSFIQSQMRFYPNLGGGKGWTDEQEKKAKQDLVSVLIRDANLNATSKMFDYSPALAQLNNWANEIV